MLAVERPCSPPPPSYDDAWCVFSTIEMGQKPRPCNCCSAVEAMDVTPGHWTCLGTGQSWLFVDSAPSATNHPESLCMGNCKQHPLLYPELARWVRGAAAGRLWGDMWQEDEEYTLSLKSEEERAAMETKAAAERVEQIRNIEVGAQKSQIKLVQEIQGRKYAARGKIAQPCKKLYDCRPDPKTGTGAFPQSRAITTECWRYEYTDPESQRLVDAGTGAILNATVMTAIKEKTAKIKNVDKKFILCRIVHSCNWLHPGEDGWCTEWETDRFFKPPQAPAPATRDVGDWEMPRSGRGRGGGGGGRSR